MPIRRDLRKFYGAAWRRTRKDILSRDHNRCLYCGVPNHTEVDRCNGGWWREIRFHGLQPPELAWRDEHGQHLRRKRGASRIRRVRIQLAVAHLNNVSGDDRPENLASLCQWCHLSHDKDQHRETRVARKDAARPLLAATLACPV